MLSMKRVNWGIQFRTNRKWLVPVVRWLNKHKVGALM